MPRTPVAPDHLSMTFLIDGLTADDGFLRRMAGAIAAAAGSGGVPALLVVAPDDLEEVAIEFGHREAEELMEEVGRRIAAMLPPDELFARVGEDRYAILCHGGERVGVRRAEQLEEVLRAPFQVAEQRLVVTACVGIAAAPGVTADGLLRKARLALRRARAAGPGSCELHSGQRLETLAKRLVLQDEMRLALEREEFVLYFQPIVSIEDGRILGLEALIRWNHPRRGLIPPCDFLPVAEQTGLISDIGRWALNQACRLGARWQDDPELLPTSISVNVSGRQLAERGFEEQVRETIARTGIRADRLVLELTESVLMQSLDSPVRVLHGLREQGVRIALDDFGTGYSSLAYLRSFPIQILKVDRSFVAELSESEPAGKILASVAQLAASLELQLVAEGIETADHVARLRALGCELGQGYLFSAAVPASELSELIEGAGTRLRA
jgi:predicted signal transduction protein with EAL and GGDEF domain